MRRDHRVGPEWTRIVSGGPALLAIALLVTCPVPDAIGAEDADAKRIARRARKMVSLYRDGYLVEARAAAAKVLALDPSHAEALFLDGAAAQRMGRIVDAHASLSALLERAPDFPQHDLRLRLAILEVLLAREAADSDSPVETIKGHYARARDHFRSVGTIRAADGSGPDPVIAAKLYETALTLQDVQLLIHAIEAFTDGVWDVLEDSVQLLVESDLVDGGVQLIDAADPERLVVFGSIEFVAVELLARGRDDAARRVASRRPATDPDSAPDWLDRCRAFLNEGATRDDAIVPPRLEESPAPLYPELARVARLQGLVIARVTIDPAGSVIDMHIERVPYSDVGFEGATTESLTEGVWSPARLCGEAVTSVKRVKLRYVLED